MSVAPTKKIAPGFAAQATAMAGNGLYNQASSQQASRALLGLDVFHQAALAIPLSFPRVHIVDYGCSQGKNSIPALTAALQALETRSSPPIEITFTDLLGNDFNSLFSVVGTAFPAAFSCRAGSFYTPLFAPNSVSLGWTANSLHWLSTVPVPLERAVSFYVRNNDDEDKSRARWTAQSVEDWKTFLACRQIELVPGGEMVHVEIGYEKDSSLLFSTVDALLRHFFSDEQLEGTCIPTRFRSLEELEAPFFEKDCGGLRLLSSQSIPSIPDVLYAAWELNGDLESYVEGKVKFLQSTLFPCLVLDRFHNTNGGDKFSLELLLQKAKEVIRASPECVKLNSGATIIRYKKDL